MSYIFLQEQGAASSAESFADMCQSAPSSWRNTLARFSSSVSETVSSLGYLSGIDVCTFDGKPWMGSVDIVAGGFPCQDISAAGRGAGIQGKRSGLWREMARIISEVRPRFVLVENSPLLVGRGLDTVLADLSEMGFDAEWGVLGAHDAGAPHKRDRIWVLAHTKSFGLEGCSVTNGLHGEAGGERRSEPVRSGAGIDQDMADSAGAGFQDGRSPSVGEPGQEQEPERCGSPRSGICEVADTDRERQQEQHVAAVTDQPRQPARCAAAQWGKGWWATEPSLGRVAHGVAHRVDRLKAAGNGQVSIVEALAWGTLAQRILALDGDTETPETRMNIGPDKH